MRAELHAGAHHLKAHPKGISRRFEAIAARRAFFQAAMACAACAALAASRANADPIILTRAVGGGAWSEPSQWTPFGVPNNFAGITFDAVLGTGATATLDENVTVDHLTFSGGGVQETAAGNPYTIDVLKGFTSTGGGTQATNLVLEAGGTIDGTLLPTTFGDGTLQNKGVMTLVSGSTSALPPHSTDPFNFSGSTVSNLAGAVIDIQGNGNISNGIVINDGLLEKTAGDSTTFRPRLTNNGRILVTHGTLNISGINSVINGRATAEAGTILNFSAQPMTISSSALLDGDGEIQLGGGDLEMNGKISGGAGFFTLSGHAHLNASANLDALALPVESGGRQFRVLGGATITLNTGRTLTFANFSTDFATNQTTIFGLTVSGTEDIILSGPSHIRGGVFSNVVNLPAFATITNNSILTVSDQGMGLDGRNLVNNGIVDLQKEVQFTLNNSASFKNSPGGRIDIGEDASISTASPYHGSATNLPTVVNEGLIVANAAGSNEIRSLLYNSGVVRVETGTLLLTGSAVNTGVYEVMPGATLAVFAYLPDTLPASPQAVIRGGGTVQMRDPFAGTYNVTGTTLVSYPVDFRPGTLLQSVGLLKLQGGPALFNTGAPAALNDVDFGGAIGGSDAVTISGMAAGTGRVMAGADVRVAGTLYPSDPSEPTFHNDGKLTLLPSSKLQIDITSEGKLGKIINNGTMDFEGALSITMINHYDPTPNVIFQLISGTGTATFHFTNVQPGQRLNTSDNLHSFVVLFGPNSLYGPNSLALFSLGAPLPVPEPAALGSVVAAGAALLRRRRAPRLQRDSEG